MLCIGLCQEPPSTRRRMQKLTTDYFQIRWELPTYYLLNAVRVKVNSSMIHPTKASTSLRTSRVIAKKYEVTNDLEFEQVKSLLNRPCDICDGVAELISLAYPLKDGAPLVQANILTLCKPCKLAKTVDLSHFFFNGGIDEARYLAIVGELVSRNGGAELKSYLSRILGLV